MKTPEFIALANAGDCRALLIRKDKTFEILIDEHKATLQEELDRIQTAGLYVSEQRVIGELMVTRSIGDFKYKGLPKEEVLHAVTCVPATKIIRIDETFAFVLLMSEGIVDGISREEICTIMMQENEVEAKILNIIQHCLSEHHSLDNMTLIAIPF
jgi:serine/threonine protein phosphatase PrpC